MYGADAHGLDKRQEHRGKNNDRGGGLHEDSSEQDDQGDQEHDHILVVEIPNTPLAMASGIL